MASRAFTSLLQAIEKGAFPRTRKWLWRGIYNGLSRHWRDDDWRFMNYGFVDQAAAFPLHSDDEPDRPFIGLYAQAVAGLPITDAQVVEIGSGRGGGARYLARYHDPAWVVGIDYSASTVRRARSLNDDTAGLSFEIGDAERLPLESASCDLVVNIESSHCYSDVPAFAQEVARVLKPGGWFTFADMRGKGAIDDLRRQLAVPGLELRSERDLSAGVVAALDAAEHRKRVRLAQVRFGRAFIAEFSGSQGSTLYRELTDGGVIYLAQRYQKVAEPLRDPSSS